jgi:hypothetical protein
MEAEDVETVSENLSLRKPNYTGRGERNLSGRLGAGSRWGLLLPLKVFWREGEILKGQEKEGIKKCSDLCHLVVIKLRGQTNI